MKSVFITVRNFIKKETVLSIAILLAAVSSFFVRPGKEYIEYIDYGTLAILFCLMAVMAGLRSIGGFDYLAQIFLNRTNRLWQVILLLVLFCYFFSMLITNDVALITFVPLAIIVLNHMPEKVKTRWLIPVVAMQTVAANLGSMLTPIGNPQNLYLYGISNMELSAFIKLMLPYSLLALILLVGWSIGAVLLDSRKEKGSGTFEVAFTRQGQISNYRKLAMYTVLFAVCLLTVARVIPYGITFLTVFFCVGICDRGSLKRIDYSLLGTFTGFFIFIGNMGRIPAFRSFLETIMEGHESITAIAASQVISNVPAALLLSGFTSRFEELIIGTNLGGLGTLIASMASLISFKYIAKENGALRGKYLLYFTIVNLLFLTCMLGLKVAVF